MAKYPFQSYNYTESSSKYKTLAINQFYGVDYSPTQLKVADNHAVDIDNIVYKDNVNQKRQGFENIFKFNNDNYYLSGTAGCKKNTTNINGIFQFSIDGTKYVIIHVGHLLYKVNGFGSDKEYLNISTELIYNNIESGIKRVTELNDNDSVAFYSNERLYILDGNNYYVLRLEYDGTTRFKLYKVEEDEETFIPTTTIGITYKDAISSSQNTVLDDANMLTQWRKNKLISGTWNEKYGEARTTTFYEYELDSNINAKNSNDIFDIEISIDTIKYNENYAGGNE